METVLFGVVLWFCLELFGGRSNAGVLGVATAPAVALGWAAGVVLRAAGGGSMRWWLLVGGVAAVLAPWLATNTVQLWLMSQVCIFVLMLLGLNIVTGYSGQISLGHGALVGIGAYATAICMNEWGWPPTLAALAAVAVTGAAGFVIGVPALRLAGPYLAIATLAAATIFPIAVKLESLAGYTRGFEGLSASRPEPPAAAQDFLQAHAPEDAYVSAFQKESFAEEAWVYYVALVPAVAGGWLAWNIGRSRFGRAFIAIRDNEVGATAMGVSAARYRVLAFGISGLYAGAAGALFVAVRSFISPDSFDVINLSITPLVYAVIGGLATVGGPVLGAFGFIWVPQLIRETADINSDFGRLQGALTGIVLIAVITRMPDGAWGAVRRLAGMGWGDITAVLRSRWPRSRRWWLGAAVAVAALGTLWALWGAIYVVFAVAIAVIAPRATWRWRAHPRTRSPDLASEGE
ncbi:MAG: branched-chain amino acid ABC transporter permease [Tepidiformaceae bacterium]